MQGTSSTACSELFHDSHEPVAAQTPAQIETPREPLKPIPFPLALSNRQILLMQRLTMGQSRACEITLEQLILQITGLAHNVDLAMETREGLELLAFDLERFLHEFDAKVPLRACLAAVSLRHAFARIIHLQSSRDTRHLPFRIFNATLIAVALEIIRCLDLTLGAWSFPGNPVWQQEPGEPSLPGTGRRNATTPMALVPERIEWVAPQVINREGDI